MSDPAPPRADIQALRSMTRRRQLYAVAPETVRITLMWMANRRSSTARCFALRENSRALRMLANRARQREHPPRPSRPSASRAAPRGHPRRNEDGTSTRSATNTDGGAARPGEGVELKVTAYGLHA